MRGFNITTTCVRMGSSSWALQSSMLEALLETELPKKQQLRLKIAITFPRENIPVLLVCYSVKWNALNTYYISWYLTVFPFGIATEFVFNNCFFLIWQEICREFTAVLASWFALVNRKNHTGAIACKVLSQFYIFLSVYLYFYL